MPSPRGHDIIGQVDYDNNQTRECVHRNSTASRTRRQANQASCFVVHGHASAKELTRSSRAPCRLAATRRASTYCTVQGGRDALHFVGGAS